MLGLEAYGSDESDSESTSNTTHPQPIPTISNKTSAFSLPPPSSVTKAPSLEPLKVKPKRPVFTVTKPSKLSSDNEDSEHERVAKKPRLDLQKRAGSSSLLAILPAPSKAAIPVAPPRALGPAVQSGSGAGIAIPPFDGRTEAQVSTQKPEEVKTTSLLRQSLAKVKTKPQAGSTTPESTPAPDFFSLGPSTSRPIPASPTSSDNSPPSISVTSAPTIPKFEPPTPTPFDPYPGYYQLPSGAWESYDPEFYKKHYESWYTAQGLNINAQKGFEGAGGDNTVEVNAQEQLDLARKEREEKKLLTANAGKGPAAPNMNIKPPKIGSRARTRHQLSALLTEAYENREALEKIAQGRRNRKEAGNKYGF